MKQIHILVADDNPFLRDLITWTLKQEGFVVSMAATGSEALILARHILPDVLILDWSMLGYLRKKLEMQGETRLIHTIRGVGFILKDCPS